MLSGDRLDDDAGLFVEIERLCGGLGTGQASEIRRAFSHALARLLEMRLLGDEVLREIARYPDVYLAQAEDLVAQRISELGLDEILDPEDARHVSRLLLAGTPPRTGAEAVGEALVAGVFQSIRGSGHRELRCAICGFQFRPGDLSASRLLLAEQYELRFADDVLPERRRDKYKPPEKTTLHVDHVVPRIGFGPTRTENLQILCEFCNAAKFVYRRALENMPAYVAGSAPPLDGIPSSRVRRHSVVAALMRYGRCATCSAGPNDRELTVRPTEPWFVPWTLAVYCYDCAPEVA